MAGAKRTWRQIHDFNLVCSFRHNGSKRGSKYDSTNRQALFGGDWSRTIRLICGYAARLRQRPARIGLDINACEFGLGLQADDEPCLRQGGVFRKGLLPVFPNAPCLM